MHLDEDRPAAGTLATVRAAVCSPGAVLLLAAALLLAVAHFHRPCPPAWQPPWGFCVQWWGWALLSLAGLILALYSLRYWPLSPAAKVLLLAGPLLAVTHFYKGLTFVPPEVMPERYRIYAWAVFNVILLLAVPLALLRPVLGLSPREVGWRLGEVRVWGKHVAVYAALMLPAIAIVSRWPQFRQAYPHIVLYGWDPHNVGALVAWEVGYATYFLAWEFFYRGLLLHGTARELGPLAIAVQTLPFVLTHSGKPEPEALGAIIAGVALGTTSYRSGSFLGCWVIHCLCACGLDLLVVLWPVR